MPTEEAAARRRRRALAALLLGAGTMHFLTPRFFDALVPTWVPGSARLWTNVSGVAELATAALVANRRTARLGGWCALAVFVAVYPANVVDAVEHPPTDARGVASLLRLPVQLLLFWWAWRVAVAAAADDGARRASQRSGGG